MQKYLHQGRKIVIEIFPSSDDDSDDDFTTTNKSIPRKEHHSFNVNQPATPLDAATAIIHSESAARDITVKEAATNAPTANTVRNVKINPTKYGDEIKYLLMERPNVQPAVAVEQLRKKFCSHDIEPSDWPGGERLNKTMRTTKIQMKKSEREQDEVLNSHITNPLPYAQVCSVLPPSLASSDSAKTAGAPFRHKGEPTVEETTMDEGSGKDFTPVGVPVLESHGKTIADKYCAMIDQLLDSNKKATAKVLLSNMKKMCIRSGGTLPPDWPGDARIKTQVREAKYKKNPPKPMAKKYTHAIEEIVRADMIISYLDVYSELIRRFQNDEDSLPEDWPGKYKIKNRVASTKRRIRRHLLSQNES